MKRNFSTYQKILVIWISCTILTIFVYYPTLSYDKTYNFDDDSYFEDVSLHEVNAENVKAQFSNFYLGMYQPLPVFTFSIFNHLVPEKVEPQRIFNLLFHLVNVLLVIYLVYLLSNSVYLAGFTALFFAVHPMHTESVVWIAARSNLMYSTFYLLAIIMYLKFKDQHFIRTWILVTLFFILALLCKVTAATLPFALILIDWFLKRKITGRSIVFYVVLAALSMFFIVTGIHAARSFGHISELGMQFSIFDRFVLLLHSLALYIVKLLVPFQLSAIYLYPAKLNNTLPVWYFAGAATFILLFFATTWWYYKQHDKIFGKQVIAGFLFFLITISIVLPLQWSRTILIAERYSYLPHIGLIISFLLLFFRLVKSRKALVRKVAYSFILVLGLVYAGIAWRQAKMWESPETLFTQVIENGQSTSDKAIGYYNRGNEYLRRRNGEKAISDYSRSVELNPKYYQAFYNRGLTAYLMGNNAGAIDDFSKSASLYPDFADAYLNRGAAYRNMGMKNEALMDYSKALELKPSALGFLNRGILYYSNFNNAEKACSDWGKAYEMGSVKAYELLNQYCVENDTIQ